MPFGGGRAGTTVAGLPPTPERRDSTPPVPDDILRPVLAAALYMVRTLAAGIQSLQAGSTRLHDGRPADPEEVP